MCCVYGLDLVFTAGQVIFEGVLVEVVPMERQLGVEQPVWLDCCSVCEGNPPHPDIVSQPRSR